MEFKSTHPILQSLREQWQEARTGQVRLCAVTSSYGASAQRLCTQFQNEIAVECLTWQVSLTPHDTGSHIIPKVLSGLHRAIHNSTRMQSTLLTNVRQRLAKTKDPTEKYHFTLFRDALHLLKLSEGKTLVFPDKTPLMALVRLIQFVAEIFPTLLLFNQADQSHSMGLFTLLQLLFDQSDDDQKLLLLLTFSSVTARSRHSQPLGLLSLLTDTESDVYDLAPLTDQEIADILKDNDSSLDIDTAKWWTGGSRALMVDLIDWDSPKHHDSIQNKSLPQLDEASEFVLSLAALLGWRFTLSPLIRLSGQTESELREIIRRNTDWLEENHSRPDGKDAFAFTRYLNWFHLRRFVATTQPQFANLVAQNIETFFPHDRELLTAAAEIRSFGEDPQQASIPRGMLWAFEDGALWFELVVLASKQSLLWPEEAWEVAFLSAFQHALAERPDEIQTTFNKARECFQRLDRPHAEIQLLCDAGQFSADVGDLDVMMDHFHTALEIAQANNDAVSNINIRLRYTKSLIVLNETRKAMVQLTLLENLAHSPRQLTEKVWISARLAELQSETEMALNLYQNARLMAVENRMRGISSSAGLSMIPLLIESLQKDKAAQLHALLGTEVQGDSTLEKQWDAAKSYFM